MNKNGVEEGITNLGLIPVGYTYAEAVKEVKDKRKYFIDPYKGGHRLTLCDTLRMSWRLVDKLPDGEEKKQLYEYLAQSFDYAKRMDARMKYLRSVLDENKIEYEKGKPSA